MTAPLLERLGTVPPTRVHLDFETFYAADYTLRKLTTESYVRDARFEVIGVGVRVGEGRTVWLEEWDFRKWAARVDWSRVACNAHHAHFEGLILAEHYGIRPGFWFCTLSLGRLLHGEGALETLAQRYELGGKIAGGLEAVKGKRRSDLTQREWQALGAYCVQDVELGAALLDRMLPAVPPLEWWAIDSTVRMFTEPVFLADTEVLGRALAEERAKKRAFLERIGGTNPTADRIEAARAMLASSEKFAELLRSFNVEPPTKPNPKGETIFAFAKSDPGMSALLEHPRDEIRFLAEARLAVKSTIVETRTERLIGIAQRGRVPFYLKFSGAHTHRWSGGDKMNPQNFNRGGALRDAITADEESEIVVADSGQIEARVLAWLAREESVLAAFKRNDLTGGDFYSDQGSVYFRRQLSKKETPTERQIAKSMILGLGFGMGWETFAGNLLIGMLGADPVQFGEADAARFNVDVRAFAARRVGLPPEPGATDNRPTRADVVRNMTTRIGFDARLIHCAVASHFVDVYRAANPRIAAFWRTADKLIHLMEIPGPEGQVRARVRGLEVMRHAVRKPSGLVLRYPGLRRSQSGRGFSYMNGHKRAPIYGGLFTENLVQSLARDVVAEQALEVRAAGYRLATTTHDEIVSVVPRGQGAAALERTIAIMRTPPAWCRDLPLNAEGGVGRRYGDAK